MFSRVLLSALIFTAGLSGCGPPKLTNIVESYERGLAENPARILLGIRPIGETWMCFRNYPEVGDEWLIHPTDNSAQKVVKRDAAGKPVTELDRYYSGRIYYVPEDGEERESAYEALFVTSDWRSGRITVDYVGDDRKLQRALDKLPPFSPKTKQAYLDFVARTVARWEKARKETEAAKSAQ